MVLEKMVSGSQNIQFNLPLDALLLDYVNLFDKDRLFLNLKIVTYSRLVNHISYFLYLHRSVFLPTKSSAIPQLARWRRNLIDG